MVTAITSMTAASIAAMLLALRFRFAFLVFLSLLLLMQNITIMLLLRFNLVPIEKGAGLLIPKEAVLLVVAILLTATLFARAALNGKTKLNRTDTLIILFLLFLTVPFALSSASIEARVAGFRGLALLPVLFLIGRWLRLPSKQLRPFFRLLVAIAAAVAIFGLIEAYLLPQGFWLSIGHEEFYLMKRGRPIQGTLYTNMRFWLPGADVPIRRVASITGDPLISSYLLAFALLLMLSYTVIHRRTNLLFVPLALAITVAMLLTLSRGATLTVLIAGGILVLSRMSVRRFQYLTLLGLLGAIVFALAFSDTILSITYGQGHIEQLHSGLIRGLNHPLGLGTGTASSTASAITKAQGGSEIFVGGGDSYIGSTATQIGIVGLTLFVAIMLSMCSDLYRMGVQRLRAATPRSWLYLATAATLAALLITSTVNESGYGYVASGLVFIFAGVLSFQAESHGVSPSRET